jgi:inorganic triphosphatase YgiF
MREASEQIMIGLSSELDLINFGDIPEHVNALLQQGVMAYRRDPARADQLFRKALMVAPAQLQVYFCLYKIHTYQGNLGEAQAAAENGLREAANQAGWPTDWHRWRRESTIPDGAGRFALYTLKALAFINLRQNDRAGAREKLDALKILDPTGSVGWPVIAALSDGLR